VQGLGNYERIGQHASAEQLNTCAPVHLSLERFETVTLNTFVAEVTNQFLRQDGPNSFDESSAQVSLNALARGRRGRLQGLSFELDGIVVITDQLFLLGIDRDHRPAARQIALRGFVDVTELRIAIWMIPALLGLAVTLQTVVQIVQELRHFGVEWNLQALRPAEAILL
jgi:hypothetical protein